MQTYFKLCKIILSYCKGCDIVKKLISLIFVILICTTITVSSHSGRTDSQGGHNVSGTDEYHYHHGYPAHQHEVFCIYELKAERRNIIIVTIIVTTVIMFTIYLVYRKFTHKEKPPAPQLQNQIKSLKEEKQCLWYVMKKHEKRADDLSHQLSITKNQLNDNYSYYTRELNQVKSHYENKLNAVTAEYKQKYKTINQRKIRLESWGNERYYITCTPTSKNSNYKLVADISLYTLFWFRVNENTFDIIKERDTLFLLDRAYWSNGGYISFKDTLPVLEFNTPITVQSDDGKSYTVTLTDQKVFATQAELNELRRKETKLNKLISESKKDINLLISEQEKSFPYFSKLLSDYRHYFNKQMAIELETKKRPAKVSAETAKTLAKQMHKLEKEYKELKYQMEFYESKFPELRELREKK